MNFLVWLILGLIAGWLASIIMRTDSQQGPVTDIILGIIGAFVGGLVMSMFGQPGASGLDIYSVLVATLGAVAVIYVGRMFRRSTL